MANTDVCEVVWLGGPGLVRDLARAALAAHGFVVTPTVALPEALEAAGRLGRGGVVVLEDDGPDQAQLLERLSALARFRRVVPVMVLSASRAPVLPAIVLDAGAAGFLGMDTPLPELIDSLARVAAGAIVLDPVAARALMGSQWAHRAHRSRPTHLSPAEQKVLQLAANGLLTKQIATKLGLSPRTVKNQMAHIRLRLDATDKAHAVATALRLGLLD